MNNYELTYIIDPRLDDNARKELIERFNSLIEANGGVIEKVDETVWGKRRLAYAINDLTEGYYVLITFKAEPQAPREIERNLQNSDKILRYLIIKIENKRRTVKPRVENNSRNEQSEENVLNENVELNVEETTEKVEDAHVTEESSQEQEITE